MKTIKINSEEYGAIKKSSHYNIIMYPDELERFQISIEEGKEGDFVDNYIIINEANGVVEKTDVYSLALICSFRNNSDYMKSFLLAEERYFDSLLVNSDTSANALCAFLEERDKVIYKEMVDYIKRHPHDIKFSTLDEYVMSKLAYAIGYPGSGGYTPASVLEDIIRPIYTEEIVESIIDVIGRDHIGNYWIG